MPILCLLRDMAEDMYTLQPSAMNLHGRTQTHHKMAMHGFEKNMGRALFGHRKIHLSRFLDHEE